MHHSEGATRGATRVILFSGTSILIPLQAALTTALDDAWQFKEGRRTRRASSTNPDPNSNWDFIQLRAGENATICDLKGPGIIRHVWFTYRVRDDLYANRNIVLSMWWDDEEMPSVECPIGDFFAVGNGACADVDSEPVQVAAEGRALNCYWPMPFARRARIEVENQGTGFVDSFYYYVDYEELKEAPKPLATFHCQYRQAYPVIDGEDYIFAEIEGRGQYVGTVLSWWSVEEGWPGEGDDRFYIDGESVASIQGTGTEDYFGSSWGFRVVNRGSYGVSVWDGAGEGCRCTAYRWHLHDPIRFERSLRATIEHRGWAIRQGKWDGHAHRPDRFSSAAFWYQMEPHATFPELPPARARIPYDEEAIELEDTLDVIESGGIQEKPRVQEGGGWSGGGQVFFPAQAQDEAWLRVPFRVPQADRYVVVLRATASYDYGIWDIYLDGKKIVSARDMYAADTHTEEIRLGGIELTAGQHVLEVRTVGRNPLSQAPGVYMGLDAILLRR